MGEDDRGVVRRFAEIAERYRKTCGTLVIEFWSSQAEDGLLYYAIRRWGNPAVLAGGWSLVEALEAFEKIAHTEEGKHGGL